MAVYFRLKTQVKNTINIVYVIIGYTYMLLTFQIPICSNDNKLLVHQDQHSKNKIIVNIFSQTHVTRTNTCNPNSPISKLKHIKYFVPYRCKMQKLLQQTEQRQDPLDIQRQC